jgi:hypothetical protein
VSDQSQGSGWWLASDGKWYPPESAPAVQAPPPPVGFQPSGYPQQRSTNGFAIASMVLGILWIYSIGSILALVFGYKARKEIDDSGGAQQGRGMATAGIVLGYIGIAGILVFIFGIVLLQAVGTEASVSFDSTGDAISGANN